MKSTRWVNCSAASTSKSNHSARLKRPELPGDCIALVIGASGSGDPWRPEGNRVNCQAVPPARASAGGWTPAPRTGSRAAATGRCPRAGQDRVAASASFRSPVRQALPAARRPSDATWAPPAPGPAPPVPGRWVSGSAATAVTAGAGRVWGAGVGVLAGAGVLVALAALAALAVLVAVAALAALAVGVGEQVRPAAGS